MGGSLRAEHGDWPWDRSYGMSPDRGKSRARVLGRERTRSTGRTVRRRHGRRDALQAFVLSPQVLPVDSPSDAIRPCGPVVVPARPALVELSSVRSAALAASTSASARASGTGGRFRGDGLKSAARASPAVSHHASSRRPGAAGGRRSSSEDASGSDRRVTGTTMNAPPGGDRRALGASRSATSRLPRRGVVLSDPDRRTHGCCVASR